MAAKTTPGLNSDRRFQLFAPGFLTWNALLTTVLSIGVNSYWAHGLKPTHFYDHGARLYDEPPHFCDVILSKFAGSVGHPMTKMLSASAFSFAPLTPYDPRALSPPLIPMVLSYVLLYGQLQES